MNKNESLSSHKTFKNIFFLTHDFVHMGVYTGEKPVILKWDLWLFRQELCVLWQCVCIFLEKR